MDQLWIFETLVRDTRLTKWHVTDDRIEVVGQANRLVLAFNETGIRCQHASHAQRDGIAINADQVGVVLELVWRTDEEVSSPTARLQNAARWIDTGTRQNLPHSLTQIDRRVVALQSVLANNFVELSITKAERAADLVASKVLVGRCIVSANVLVDTAPAPEAKQVPNFQAAQSLQTIIFGF